MKRLIQFAVVFFGIGSGLAVAGLPILNVSSAESTLTISHNVPNHSYSNVGIKGRTADLTFSDCTVTSNGYCLFSLAANQTKTMTATGATGAVPVTVCLNGKGPLSCVAHTMSISAGSASCVALNSRTDYLDSGTDSATITGLSTSDWLKVTYTLTGPANATFAAYWYHPTTHDAQFIISGEAGTGTTAAVASPGEGYSLIVEQSGNTDWTITYTCPAS